MTGTGAERIMDGLGKHGEANSLGNFLCKLWCLETHTYL